jgi:hypothetical protein
MKTQTKEFIEKLANLMEEYGASFEVTEAYNWGRFEAGGLEVNLKQGDYKSDDWFWDCIELSKFPDAEELRKMLEEDK